MRFPVLLCLAIFNSVGQFCSSANCQEPNGVSLATHNQSQIAKDVVDSQAVERIRKIVLNQGDDARALANLVQLTRELPAAATSQLYYDLASEYLCRGKYNQATGVLQQLVNQYPKQPITAEALVQMLRVFSSSEVIHSQQLKYVSKGGQTQNGKLAKYGLFAIHQVLQQNAALANNPALTFQRAVATRAEGRGEAALGRLTKLKHDLSAEPWRSRAKAEQWLTTGRADDSPLPTMVCRRAQHAPHLDGVLDEEFWQSNGAFRFAYDEGFLYIAISQTKAAELSYPSESRPRTHDAELADNDRVEIRLDADRDYATCYELAVDYRGWTQDRCWLDTGWDPKWFVAASGDASRWTIEAAISWDSLASSPPSTGDAWAVAFRRVLPGIQVPAPASEATSSVADGGDFQLLLFE